MSELENRICRLIVDVLNLEDIAPGDINIDEPLFGDGLGLDSIDALEIGMEIQKTFGIKIDTQQEDVAAHFASVRALARFIAQQEKAA